MIVVQRALGVTTNYHTGGTVPYNVDWHNDDGSSLKNYNGCAILLSIDLRDCLLFSILELIRSFTRY